MRAWDLTVHWKVKCWLTLRMSNARFILQKKGVSHKFI